jgi:hypothetical protein
MFTFHRKFHPCHGNVKANSLQKDSILDCVMIDSEGYVRSLSVIRFPVDTSACQQERIYRNSDYIHTTSFRVETRPITKIEMVPVSVFSLWMKTPVSTVNEIVTVQLRIQQR